MYPHNSCATAAGSAFATHKTHISIMLPPLCAIYGASKQHTPHVLSTQAVLTLSATEVTLVNTACVHITAMQPPLDLPLQPTKRITLMLTPLCDMKCKQAAYHTCAVNTSCADSLGDCPNADTACVHITHVQLVPPLLLCTPPLARPSTPSTTLLTTGPHCVVCKQATRTPHVL